MACIAINGLGPIGRAALKLALDTPDLELVAINDLLPPDNLAYLLRHDSRYNRSVEVVLSAPAKSDGVETVVHGVNQASENANIISTASCTTHCIPQWLRL